MAYQQTLANGTVLIEEFQILGHLGSGGFANTYLAMDLTLGREVAVKEYFPSELAVRSGDARVEVKSQSHGAQFEWALGRFVREAKTLAKFRHPSVVRVFRVFNANHTAYIVLEFVRGSNMEAWQGARPPAVPGGAGRTAAAVARRARGGALGRHPASRHQAGEHLHP